MTNGAAVPPVGRALIPACFAIFISASTAAADVTLSLAAGSTLPGGVAVLNLNMAVTGTAPAGLQWTFRYAAADITSVQVVAGPAATSAGMTLYCASGNGTHTCLPVGTNSNTIAAGSVATTTFQFSPTPSGGTIPIQVPCSLSSSLPGDSIPSSGASRCTVTLSAAAPVAATATNASFTANVAAVSTNATAQLTATLNGSSARASLSPAAAVAPASLAAGATSSCTVTL